MLLRSVGCILVCVLVYVGCVLVCVGYVVYVFDVFLYVLDVFLSEGKKILQKHALNYPWLCYGIPMA